jgi:hypothetical protein
MRFVKRHGDQKPTEATAGADPRVSEPGAALDATDTVIDLRQTGANEAPPTPPTEDDLEAGSRGLAWLAESRARLGEDETRAALAWLEQLRDPPHSHRYAIRDRRPGDPGRVRVFDLEHLGEVRELPDSGVVGAEDPEPEPPAEEPIAPAPAPVQPVTPSVGVHDTSRMHDTSKVHDTLRMHSSGPADPAISQASATGTEPVPEGGRVHDTSRMHDTHLVHDVGLVHDTRRVHVTHRVHGKPSVHDTSRTHDATRAHDTSRVHDTSAVHDTSRIHATGSGSRHLLRLGPALGAVPEPTAPPTPVPAAPLSEPAPRSAAAGQPAGADSAGDPEPVAEPLAPEVTGDLETPSADDSGAASDPGDSGDAGDVGVDVASDSAPSPAEAPAGPTADRSGRLTIEPAGLDDIPDDPPADVGDDGWPADGDEQHEDRFAADDDEAAWVDAWHHRSTEASDVSPSDSGYQARALAAPNAYTAADAAQPSPYHEPTRRRRTPVAAAVGGAVLVVVLAALAASGQLLNVSGSSTSTEVAGPAAPVARWLADNTTGDVHLAVPVALHEQLQDALPGRVVTAYQQTGARQVVLVLPAGRKDYQALAGADLSALAASAMPAAVFPGLAVEVRQILPGGAWDAEHALLRRQGRAVLLNTQLRLAPPAWAALAGGNVDPRLIALLTRTVTGHTVDVSAFPRSATARTAGAPARAMQVVAVDGRLVGSAGAAKFARDALAAQVRPGLPATFAVVGGDSGSRLVVTFPLPMPAAAAAAASFSGR